MEEWGRDEGREGNNALVVRGIDAPGGTVVIIAV